MKRKKSSTSKKTSALPVINPNAAGIDVGATPQWVAVPKDRVPEPVGRFDTPSPPICIA